MSGRETYKTLWYTVIPFVSFYPHDGNNQQLSGAYQSKGIDDECNSHRIRGNHDFLLGSLMAGRCHENIQNKECRGYIDRVSLVRFRGIRFRNVVQDSRICSRGAVESGDRALYLQLRVRGGGACTVLQVCAKEGNGDSTSNESLGPAKNSNKEKNTLKNLATDLPGDHA